jgi:hypothetical protein
MAKFKTWRGKQVTQEVAQKVAAALGEFGLTAEGHAKRELRKGHGVITGKLRRSIHTAEPGYNWSGDDGSSELGGQKVDASVNGSRIVVQLGSGLGYALPVHQGHQGFEGYHFLTIGVDKARKEMPAILKRHQL